MTDHPRHVLVVGDGGAADRERLDASWPGWSEGIGFVVVADGGLRLAEALGFTVDRWVGDGDSVDPTRLASLQAAGVPCRLEPADKDQSDTELALLDALDEGATEITLLGVLGGPRFDHAIANVGLLAHQALEGRTARLLADDARVSLIRAPEPDGGPVDRSLPGTVGDLVSLLPLGDDVQGVTTRGLQFPLRDEALPAGPARGLSNVRVVPNAGVAVRSGLLLVVEVPATLAT
jgi:thiamine pyrophosphokinase